ncbi:TadE/TadG family type IV pilus assembly protein [Vibrio salinus]|uniref:TadE/TadG family type IV pilus assembly protein n=1 Tax=Vibrio salinus TaxID=2899784 RepID=UPI001E5C2DA9|nr:TadE family protein [Vibrio salinus]MCE0494318.1 pilus assembly protein [Vibrio salinus]
MKSRSLKKQKGLSAIEFAITMPLIFILMGAVIELGLMLVKYQTLTKLVQNGARYAATEIYDAYGIPYSEAQEKIICVVVTGSTSNLSAGCGNTEDKPLAALEESDVTVTENGDYVNVTAVYHYSPFVDFAVIKNDFTFELSASAIMRMTR